ncbi:3-alpha-hydroxysteroid sulfotransferase-like [Haemaphysalis longicornis]
MPSLRRKPGHQVINGVPRCPFITPKSLQEGLDFSAKKGDLLQVTYPKSGTHWVQYIVQLTLREAEPLNSYQEFMNNAPFIEYLPGPRNHTTSNAVRTLLTHLPLRKENINTAAKYIYVARNPWDCCVSLYHYVKDLSIYGFEDGTFDDFLDAFLEGDFGYGDYFEHVVGGYSLKDEPNVFFVTYEELKKNTRSTVLRLARFIGERHGNMLENDGKEGQKLLDLIIQRSAPENMRNIMYLLPGEHNNARVNEKLIKYYASSKLTQGGDKGYNFVRKGKVGGWKEYFSPNQLERMEATIAKKTHCSGVMSLWSDIRHEAMRICDRLE